MVSPWFAAGAGFVIAAGAFIYAPHASLSFDTAPNQTLCAAAGCPVPQKVPTMAGGESGLITPPPAPSRHAAHGDPDSAADFTYTVEQYGAGLFKMTFTVTSNHAIGPWQLAFEIPGATNLSVTGATWRASGTDGGTASGPAVGSTPNSSQSPSAAAGGAGSGSGGGAQSAVVTFVVVGEGAPSVAPGHCVFNNSPCQFTLQH
jgi:hypothetical protein